MGQPYLGNSSNTVQMQYASKLQHIIFSDSGTQNLVMTAYQYANDLGIINKISSPHTIEITSNQNYSAGSPSSVSIPSGIDPLVFLGKPNILDLSGKTTTVVHYDTTYSNEIIEITHMQKGIDSIVMNFNGTTLKTLDINVDWQPSVLLQASSDSRHGVVIVGTQVCDLSINGNIIMLA